MKAKVTKAFRDKYNFSYHRINEVIEVSEERFNEINSRTTHIESVKETSRKPVKKVNKK